MSWSAGEDRFTLAGPPGLLCFTTTRREALPPGEADAAVLLAAAGVRAAGPRVVAGMEQVHGARVVKVGQGAASQILPSCDGLVTGQPGVALIVRTADCLPLVAFDPGRGMLGAAHAGWRGVRAGIPARLVEVMGPGDLWVAVGPAIGPCCYAVGPEFDAWFPGHLRKRDSGRFLDLAGAAEAQLRAVGVPGDRIVRAPWCTFCERELCSSYRREGEQAGRMVTCAMMVE